MLLLPPWVSADCNLLVSGSPSCVIVTLGQTYPIDPLMNELFEKLIHLLLPPPVSNSNLLSCIQKLQ